MSDERSIETRRRTDSTETSSPEPVGPLASAPNCRVLLIEDNDGDARLTQEALTSSGFELVRAETIAEALGKLGDVDLILTDLGLPDARGLGAVDRLLEAAPHLPIVVLTGVSDLSIGRHAVRRGAEDFVSKSGADFAALARTLRYSLERHAFRKRLEDLNRRLTALSALDPLTEVLNRRGLEEVFANEMSRARREGGTLAAVIIDCDDFKAINDRFGHAVGDAVLHEIAQRVVTSKRGADALGRIGGDEFLLLLPNTRLAEAGVAAERARMAVSTTPVVHQPEPIHVTLSLGVRTVPLGVDSIHEVLQLTRAALKASKASGKDRVTTTSIDGDTTRLDGEHVRSLLVEVMSRNELGVFAQPIIGLGTDRAVGWEILVRGPEGPFCNPTELFRAARAQGNLVELDTQCLKACYQAAVEAPLDGFIHLNVLPSTLLEIPVDSLLAVFRNGSRARVCIELSEQQFIGHPHQLIEQCRALRKAGVRLAIDDIGAGRGNFDSVILLEPDVIKIDISLVRGAGDDSRKYRLIERLVLLANALEVEVVAEGIEDANDLDAMSELGIALGQGYYWTAPLPVTDISERWPTNTDVSEHQRSS
ncbi:MAG: EAL domain-containing protein [Thermoanaerobaculia bacterium]|nr:EAL domain-containing protein [Thermoanaerobaculia bacterium]